VTVGVDAAELELFQCCWGEGGHYLVVLEKLELLQAFYAFIGVEIDGIEVLQN
jgi:hypothetical protein